MTDLGRFVITDSKIVKYLGNESIVIIPDGITAIGDWAFYTNDCIEKVVLSESVKEIGSHAFGGCSNLHTVVLNNGLISIGKAAFWSCEKLNHVNIPNSVTEIGEKVFGYDMFYKSEQFTMTSRCSLTAEQYALNNGLNYIPIIYKIAVVGGLKCGKSTFINALLEYPLLPTCKLTLDCITTTLLYSDTPRIIVTDKSSCKKVLDINCSDVSNQLFTLLKEYACMLSYYKIVENLQYFSDKNLYNMNESFPFENTDELKMDKSNPRHVALLLMILLVTDVKKYGGELPPKAQAADRKRSEVLRILGFPEDILDYSITVFFDCKLLTQGVSLVYLPSQIGVYHETELRKGHCYSLTEYDDLHSVDTFLLLEASNYCGCVSNSLDHTINSASMRFRAEQGDSFIPIITKSDLIFGESAVGECIQGFQYSLTKLGINKSEEQIYTCAGIYGEARFAEFPIERTLFYKRRFQEALEEIEYEYVDHGEEFIHQKARQLLKKKLMNAYHNKSNLDEIKKLIQSL